MKLYKHTKNGLYTWEIIQNEDLIITRWGKFCGTIQRHEEEIEDGLAGRSLQEQIDLMIASKIKKKRDSGYVDDPKDATIVRNALGFKKPMLAKPFKNVPNIPTKGSVQLKYDGHRCLITKHEGKIIAYSRNGQLITTISHIKNACKNLPNGITLDGELYIHGAKLQVISSYVRKKQESTARLTYVVYDCITPGTFLTRLAMLKGLIKQKCLTAPIIIAPCLVGIDIDTLPKLLIIAKDEGFEGLIFRTNDLEYEDSKRSNSLIKIKSWIDNEFTVIKITESKDNWAILHCKTPSGKLFTVSAPGTTSEKRTVLLNKKMYIGKSVKVKYANLTKEGKPFHPVAECWREIE